jgi:hypothetical protein
MATPHGGVRCPALTGADNTGIRSGPLFAAGHEPANPLGGVTSARPDIPGEVLSAQNGEALGVPTRALLAAASARVGPAARQFCRHTLSGWHLTAVAADANWLSVNGLLHGSPPIELALSMVSATWRSRLLTRARTARAAPARGLARRPRRGAGPGRQRRRGPGRPRSQLPRWCRRIGGRRPWPASRCGARGRLGAWLCPATASPSGPGWQPAPIRTDRQPTAPARTPPAASLSRPAAGSWIR